MLRTAQPLVVEARRCTMTGVDPAWIILWDVVVEEIEINHGAKSNRATIRFNSVRWNEQLPITFGWQIRIRTDQVDDSTILFHGFASGYRPSFAGGNGSSDAREEVAVECRDFRWLLAKTSPCYGQYARGVDDYNGSTPCNEVTFFSARKLVFNASGKPDKDPTSLTYSVRGDAFTAPIFADKNRAEYWMAGEMIGYILNYLYNRVYNIFPILTTKCIVHSGDDFNRVIHSVDCEGMTIPDAIEKICKNIGLTWREEYTAEGPRWVFYKPGEATGYQRISNQQTILHTLHAPAVQDTIDIAVAAGAKLLAAANFAEDIDSVVNNPWGLGDVHTFEITVNLVPGWADSELTLDSASSYANVFKTDADLATETNPNQFSFFQRYHARGNAFQRDIGRKWVLNEVGAYSGGSYDRGDTFDFAAVIPDAYIKDSKTGKRLYGPFNRRFLPCLTFDKDSLNSVGIKVEFSFDSGSTWQVLPATLSSLTAECGVRITTQNLAELVDLNKSTIASGTLAGFELNYFSSLADDKIASRVFKTGGWKTRVRVTACVEMDNRLIKDSRPAGYSGSPFLQAAIYNFKDRYSLTQRTSSSSYYGQNLPAWETDESDKLAKHIDGIRQANEDLSINGSFTLDRLWLGDGAGVPDFALGDCIEKITGREMNFKTQVAGRTVYPEIIQITYLPVQQKQKLITRDLRLAETA